MDICGLIAFHNRTDTGSFRWSTMFLFNPLSGHVSPIASTLWWVKMTSQKHLAHCFCIKSSDVVLDVTLCRSIWSYISICKRKGAAVGAAWCMVTQVTQVSCHGFRCRALLGRWWCGWWVGSMGPLAIGETLETAGCAGCAGETAGGRADDGDPGVVGVYTWLIILPGSLGITIY